MPFVLMLVLTCLGALLHDNVQASAIERTITVDGTDRTFYFETPSTEAPPEGWPVLLLFHGRGQSANLWDGGSFYRFKQLALQEGIATIAADSEIQDPPDSFTNPDRFWLAWHLPLGESNTDIDLVEALITEFLSLQPDVNPNAVHAAGFSNGGIFVMFLAQYLPHRVQSVFVQAAGYVPSYDLLKNPAFNWDLHGGIATDHAPAVILNGLWDFVTPPNFGSNYRDDLVNHGVQACHVMDFFGWHNWSNLIDKQYIALIKGELAVQPDQHYCPLGFY